MRHTILLSTIILSAGACASAQEPALSRPYLELGPTDKVAPRTVRNVTPVIKSVNNSLNDTVFNLPEITREQIGKLLPYQFPTGTTRLYSGYRHLEPVSFSRDIVWMVPDVSESVVDKLIETDEDGVDFEEFLEDETIYRAEKPQFDILTPNYSPVWLSRSRRARRMAEDLEYSYIISHPMEKAYLSWELPEPPKLLEDDYSFSGFIKRLDIPEVVRQEHLDVGTNFKKTHWLHTTTDGIQFSQAYVSPNWYQGGNSYLALLFNFYWNVQLNQVYHPNLMFQSTLSYKLALNSVEDKYHKYSISQDLFQYNLKAGFKALKNWFYSFNLQFKTQFLNNYESNSMVRKAGFLSPSELTAGLGMTYNKNFKNDRLKFSASIAPATYNLKTCIDPKIDPVQYGIKLGRKFVNEGGSSAEMSLDWNLTDNINWKARVFLFTDYNYFMGDWENTLTFTINRFLSTQLYTHLRYDSSTELRPGAKWNHWMLKEILSFGLTYTFSTGK